MILRTTRGVTPAEFKAIASLFMADDDGLAVDKVLDAGQDEMLTDWLDAQARQLGFDAWTVAYDEIDDRGFLR